MLNQNLRTQAAMKRNDEKDWHTKTGNEYDDTRNGPILEYVATILYRFLNAPTLGVKLDTTGSNVSFKSMLLSPDKFEHSRIEQKAYHRGLGRILAIGFFLNDVDILGAHKNNTKFGSGRTNVFLREKDKTLFKIDLDRAFDGLNSFNSAFTHFERLAEADKEKEEEKMKVCREITGGMRMIDNQNKSLIKIDIAKGEDAWKPNELNKETREEFIECLQKITEAKIGNFLKKVEEHLTNIYKIDLNKRLPRLSKYLQFRQHYILKRILPELKTQEQKRQEEAPSKTASSSTSSTAMGSQPASRAALSSTTPQTFSSRISFSPS